MLNPDCTQTESKKALKTKGVEDVEKEVLLDLLDEFLLEGIHVVDKNGNTLLYNEEMANLEHIKVEEAYEKSLLQIYPSLKQSSTLLNVIATGKPIKNELQTYLNQAGKKICTLNSTWPIVKKGQVIAAVEISRDITKLKKIAHSILQIRENRNAKVFRTPCKKNKYCFEDIIGNSQSITEAKKIAMMASKTSSNILIIGESGTGKELFGQSIHNASNRSNKAFVAENCAALPESLLEGLLFGTVKGGFTGAIDRPGVLQQADGGTIMLDEINSMPVGLQAKLLRVIQEGKFRPIGGNHEIEVDVRIIAVINEDPMTAIKAGRLREDLFYRLSVVNIVIPPLRERKEDICTLIEFFLKKLEKKLNKKIAGLHCSVEKILYHYHWPGNVRELEHVLEGIMNLIDDGELITEDDLPYYLRQQIRDASENVAATKFSDCPVDFNQGKISNLNEYLSMIEENLILEALRCSRGNISKAAELLGISRQALQYKIRKGLLLEIIGVKK